MGGQEKHGNGKAFHCVPLNNHKNFVFLSELFSCAWQLSGKRKKNMKRYLNIEMNERTNEWMNGTINEKLCCLLSLLLPVVVVVWLQQNCIIYGWQCLQPPKDFFWNCFSLFLVNGIALAGWLSDWLAATFSLFDPLTL